MIECLAIKRCPSNFFGGSLPCVIRIFENSISKFQFGWHELAQFSCERYSRGWHFIRLVTPMTE
jgi:hypothetical protein